MEILDKKGAQGQENASYKQVVINSITNVHNKSLEDKPHNTIAHRTIANMHTNNEYVVINYEDEKEINTCQDDDTQ